jgi:hypothetical protein
LNDMDQELGWLTSSMFSPEIHAARETYRADFVSLIISYGSGKGWCGGFDDMAFSVVNWFRAVDTWSLAHEMGHNQGCNHNREDAGEGCSASSNAYGWHFFGNSGTEWGTVMSYLGTRIPHFSNPLVNYDGQPTGVPIGESNAAYNVDTINALTFFHEDYRLTRYDIWVDLDYVCGIPTCDGTYYRPYMTLASALAEVPVGAHPSDLPSLWIKSSSSSETMSINKPVTLRACNGPVVIGAAP